MSYDFVHRLVAFERTRGTCVQASRLGWKIRKILSRGLPAFTWLSPEGERLHCAPKGDEQAALDEACAQLRANFPDTFATEEVAG